MNAAIERIEAMKKQALDVYLRARNASDLKRAYELFDGLCAPYKALLISKKISRDECNTVFQYSEFLSAVMNTYFHFQQEWEGKRIILQPPSGKLHAMEMSLNLAKGIYYGGFLQKSLIKKTPFMTGFLKQLESKIIQSKKVILK